MPLIEKEVIAPGTYFYVEEKTGLPRRLDVTSDLTKYWRDQGKEMLNAGLTIPVPYEHDFSAHPMTPKDKLLNNAGWTADYKVKDAPDGRKDVLYSVLDVTDEDVAKKLPNTIRYTSPWINSFTDGNGRHWRNVISHIALTTRPRITKQAPFGSIAAALSMADTVSTLEPHQRLLFPEGGACLSRAGRVVQRKADKRLFAVYPMAFSLFTGAALGADDMPPKKKGGAKPPPKEGTGAKPGETPAKEESEYEEPSGSGDSPEVPGADKGGEVDLPPLGDKAGDVSMEEVLCDLLRALGVDCQHDGNEEQFKRNLYMAAMKKVHDLTNKGMNPQQPQPGQVNKGNPPGNQPNPIITQEQQPMYMSLEKINEITDPTMKDIALSMYNENVKANAERDAMKKKLESLETAKLKEAGAARAARIAKLSQRSPKVKEDLGKMVALPNMALSMGDDGNVVDPMDQTLLILERGLSDLPKLLETPSSALSVAPHPTDNANELTQEQIDAIVEQQTRNMGCVPEQKKAG